jgi:biopolymer transport protein ExbB
VLLDWLAKPLIAVRELVSGGGPFVMWIFLAGVLLWALILERYWYFSQVLPNETKQVLDAWAVSKDHSSWSARQIRKMMISRLNAAMSANLPLMRVLVPLSPLLGLIGTVSGMMEVFDSMALRGSADARTMASGVSHAMICTLSGLAVSISGLFPVYYFNSRVKRETELLNDHLLL